MATDYTQLITGEHRDKPRFAATVALLAGALGQVAENLSAGLTAFDVDSGEGDQLDKVGEWVGIGRRQQVPLAGVYFAFDTAGLGWDQGVWKGPFDPAAGLVVLDDVTYRSLLTATIASNYWVGTVEEVQQIANTAMQPFGLYVTVLDNMNMSYDVFIVGTPSATVKSLISRGVFPPKVAGVRLNAVSIVDHPLFGLDTETEFIAGLDEGYFS